MYLLCCAYVIKKRKKKKSKYVHVVYIFKEIENDGED